MRSIATFSYPLFVLLLGCIIFVVTSRIPQLKRPLQITILLVYTLVAIFVGMSFQYPDSPSDVESVADIENMLINEKPTFVMLYSNY